MNVDKYKLSIFFGLSLVLFAGWSQAELIDISSCTPQTFKVTAYYSPLAGQDFYYRGDYEDEMILNGRGTHGASGRPVFNGMVAAPSTYAFGTKIYFPELGIGQVEDRGGAIVNKGERGEEYDRIDLRVGAGEEGLMRALSFGVQYVEAYVCDDSPSDHIGLNMDNLPIHKNFFATSLWVLQLGEGRKDPWVKALQTYMSALGYFPSNRVTGYFGEVTKASVCKFQQDYLGIGANSIWCGYFGPQTRSTMYRALANNNIFNKQLASDDQLVLATLDTSPTPAPVIEEKEEIIPSKATTPPPTDDAPPASADDLTLSDEINQYYLSIGDSRRYQFLNPLPWGTANKEVKLLQRKLQVLGHYPERISGVYDTATQQAVFAFQLEQGVLRGDENAALFGLFGPATRKAINSL